MRLAVPTRCSLTVLLVSMLLILLRVRARGCRRARSSRMVAQEGSLLSKQPVLAWVALPCQMACKQSLAHVRERTHAHTASLLKLASGCRARHTAEGPPSKAHRPPEGCPRLQDAARCSPSDLATACSALPSGQQGRHLLSQVSVRQLAHNVSAGAAAHLVWSGLVWSGLVWSDVSAAAAAASGTRSRLPGLPSSACTNVSDQVQVHGCRGHAIQRTLRRFWRQQAGHSFQPTCSEPPAACVHDGCSCAGALRGAQLRIARQQRTTASCLTLLCEQLSLLGS